jgi:hypothetical protein
MRPFAFSSSLSIRGRSLPADGAIEWEELPSLVESLAQRLVILGVSRVGIAARTASAAGGSASPWDSTRPAALEPNRLPDPFHEPFNGLAVREVREPDVFRHFFGALKDL